MSGSKAMLTSNSMKLLKVSFIALVFKKRVTRGAGGTSSENQSEQ